MAMEYLRRGFRAVAAQLGPEVASIKNIKSEMALLNVKSQKDLPLEVRLRVAKPFFERSMKNHNGEPAPVGADLGLYFNLVEWFGEDVIASLIDVALIHPEFDFTDRNKKTTSLADYLRHLAQDNGWKA